jgi:hypothetical protein
MPRYQLTPPSPRYPAAHKQKLNGFSGDAAGRLPHGHLVHRFIALRSAGSSYLGIYSDEG